MAVRFSFIPSTRQAQRRQCALLCLVAALGLALPAQAASHRADASAAQGSKRKKGGQRVRVPTQRSSSDESPEQRDKRLYRECQGRHTPEHAPDTPGSRRAGASADTLPETVLGRPRIPKNPAKPCHHWIFSHLCTPEFSPIHGTTPIF